MQHDVCYTNSKMLCKMEDGVQVGLTIFYVFWSYFVYLDRIMWIVVTILYILVQAVRKFT